MSIAKIKTKTCQRCGFLGLRESFGKQGYSNYCQKCFNERERERYFIKRGKTVSPKRNSGEWKKCKECEFEGEKSLFHSALCKVCFNKKQRTKWLMDHGPPKPRSNIKVCKECKLEGDEFLFHGLYCNPCYRKRRLPKIKKDVRERLKRDPVFKLRLRVSKSIRQAIKINGTTKNGSIIKFLPYTINELKCHIENQFESWMTWNNWGMYNPRYWDDNDSSTWIWQLDHIIPQHSLPYISMKDENFRKCWALENLRPFSAKQNIMDGSRRSVKNLRSKN